MKKLIYLVAVVLVSCQPKSIGNEKTAGNTGNTNETTAEIATIDTRENKVYHASRTQLTALVNTKLEVSFDWTKSWMYGKETLTAKPYFYPNSELVLDAQAMSINSITQSGKACVYTYKDDVLTIQLDKTYQRGEEYTVVIDYIAKPEDRKAGGSAAISSDKGLYFINPTGKEKNKMPQIWTQGETQANSVWFPTIDSPNSKSKQEIYITVDDKYTTLSNGKMLSSKKNADGTRTDYWKQDLPHAPYLFMMGIGEFKVVKDSYTRPDGSVMEVNYYVEPEWEKNAKSIFGETPAMIAYFSKLLGVEYPWDKYSQIVVRDYVSGAMENTGAVVFGDFVYKTDRELLDANDQSTIAHELFHHWFGDLVTCESWSNLTVNESFANYSQFLWDEHRYGLDEAEFQAIQEADGYFATGEQAGYHNLVWFDYDSREEMFDGHSYNKGGRILHMLRKYIGDEAFFGGLKNYLKTNQFKTGEFHQLRLALEETCGQDLNWFFNQWYLGKGHPILKVNYEVKTDSVYVKVNQTQKNTFGLFKLPIQISVFDDRGETKKLYWCNDENTVLAIPTKGKLQNVIFDADAALLGKINETKDPSWYVYQWNHSERYLHRKTAFTKISSSDANMQRIILEGLKDPFWDIRSTAVSRVSKLSDETRKSVVSTLKTMLTSDPNSSVRAACVSALKSIESPDNLKDILISCIQKDQSYTVISAALTQLSTIDSKSALELCSQLEKETSGKMQVGVSTVYAKYGGAESIAYFQRIFNSNILQGFDKISVLSSLTYFASLQGNDVKQKTLPLLQNEYTNGGMYSRMFIPQYVNYLIQKLEKENTTSPSTETKQLLEQYKAFEATLDKESEE